VSESGYRLRVTAPAARALSNDLPEKIAAPAYEFITGALLADPRRVGKPLVAPMTPAWSARRGQYRVLYLVDDAEGVVTVTAVRHRRDAYRA
jgi:mRNA-degrading endonuclease RelE of RelBE toxin-antitoxin system